jgi:hypothetical protein
MQVLLQRAGTVLLVLALLLAAAWVSLRYVVGSGRPGGPGAAGREHAAAHGRAGSRASPNAGGPGGVFIDAGGGPARTPAGRPSAVALGGAAALPSARIRPGYATPADAVDGFYQALLTGTRAGACGYVAAPCPSFGSGPITGRVTILAAVAHGGQALVEITGTICLPRSCRLLTDQVLMPVGPSTFGTSWASLTSGTYGLASSPLPCVRDPATGRWRVKLS